MQAQPLPKLFKERVRRFARSVGYEIARTDSLQDRLLTNHVAAVLDKCRVTTVIDVGANRGQYRDFLRDTVGFEGLIVSFEPIGSDARLLEQRARDDDRWIVYGVALGAEEGTLPLNVMRGDTFSSFLRPDASHVTEFREKNVVDHVEQVPVWRLDRVLAELASARELGNLYLKMDTQGYDLEVVRGCGRTLRTIRALQTEVSMRPLYEGMPDFHTVVTQLEAEGFGVTGMFPVNRDAMLRVIEFDCVMINGTSGPG